MKHNTSIVEPFRRDQMFVAKCPHAVKALSAST